MLALPVHIIDSVKEKETLELPMNSICYLVGSNGIFQHTDNDFYTITKKLDEVKGLAKLEPKTKLHVRKLPYSFIKEAGAFFAAVYKDQQSEAIVLLYCHPQYGWRMDAPSQSAVGLHVDYDLRNEPTAVKGYRLTRQVEVEEKGAKVMKPISRTSETPECDAGEEVTEEFQYKLFGTIHSHANAGAFHSGTDDKDEKQFDGLHITIGNVNVASHSYSCRWVLSGEFFKADMQDAVEDPPESFFDERWLKRVTKKTYATGYVGGASGSRTGALYPSDPDYYRSGGGGVHVHRSFENARDGTPTDGTMRDWWPEGAPKGGAAPSGNTFPGKEETGGRGVSILPDGRGQGSSVEAGTPEKEARLRIMSLFISIPDIKHRRNYFEKLERKWKDFLIHDLVQYHPVDAAGFLQGVGVASPKSSNDSSDASSQNAVEKRELTSSPSQSNVSRQGLLPPPAVVTAEQPKPKAETDYQGEWAE
jgi:hypothetical protein